MHWKPWLWNRRTAARVGAAALFALASTMSCQLNADRWLIDDLPNPGRGWATFHSFNSDSRNAHYPESTIAYYRFTWRELEPVQGQIAFDVIENLLVAAAADGQRLAFRVMPDCGGCQGETVGVPQWLIDAGIGGTWYASDAFMPDFNDPLYLEQAERFVRALGERLNGDPRIDHLDIGMVGHWGEWHVSDAAHAGATMPSVENQMAVIDWHVESFPDTPLMMLVGDTSDESEQALAYAIQRGTGWRADCWGDMGRGWNHMEDFYPARIAGAAAGDAWRTTPIALETCGVPSTWMLLFPRRVDQILQFAIDNHVSILNGKSAAIPRLWTERFREFTAKIGYRFELTDVSVPTTIAPGSTAEIGTVWANWGNAPVYRGYRAAVRLRQRGAAVPLASGTFVAPTDARTWLPGTGWSASIALSPPADTAPGPYAVDLALMDVPNGEAGLRFITPFPVTADGWVTVGEILVE